MAQIFEFCLTECVLAMCGSILGHEVGENRFKNFTSVLRVRLLFRTVRMPGNLLTEGGAHTMRGLFLGHEVGDDGFIREPTFCSC